MGEYGSDFKPGDTVEFCGEIATVVKNYGNSGLVDCGDGQYHWYWIFQGDMVTLVDSKGE